jgi:hypothetical protein
VIGHRLGLYRALADGPLTADELADATATHVRPVREWLYGQAAGGYVTVTTDGRFTLSPEQAFCLADPDRAVYLPGAFQLALGALQAEPRITESFRTGAGLGWHEHNEASSSAARRSSGPAMSPTSRRSGSRRPAISSSVSPPAAGSPTSAAAWAPRRSSWRRPIQPRSFGPRRGRPRSLKE